MLFCSSEEGTPTPSYSWEKLDTLPRLPHNAMQGITNKLAIGVPFCPNFAGKCHTHGWAPAPLTLHHLCHLSCARPTSLLTHSRWSWWGRKWMDGRERSPVFWMIVPVDGINPEDVSTSVFLGSFFFFHAEYYTFWLERPAVVAQLLFQATLVFSIKKTTYLSLSPFLLQMFTPSSVRFLGLYSTGINYKGIFLHVLRSKLKLTRSQCFMRCIFQN